MIHAAQGSDLGGKGFLRRSVLPSTVGAIASRSFDVIGPEGCCGGPLGRTAARMDELHAYDGSAQRDDGELAQDGWDFDLAFFEAETLALHGSEELLDVPASAVVGDRVVGSRDGLDGGARHEPPMDRLNVPQADRSRGRQGHKV